MEREYVFAAQKGWNADEADGAGFRGFLFCYAKWMERGWNGWRGLTRILILLRKKDGTRMGRMARVDADFNFAEQNVGDTDFTYWTD